MNKPTDDTTNEWSNRKLDIQMKRQKDRGLKENTD